MSVNDMIRAVENAAPVGSANARDVYLHLKKEIQLFESCLDNSKNVGLQLASFGHSITLTVGQISYKNPCLICFYGLLPDGSRAQLIQHINQLNFMLCAVERPNPEEPRRSIGFQAE
ncbi:MAG: hypothetical protein J1G06_04420 [Oscillospiraceae bacterium]|nr:hypothetical protein [Oscillospiraceae bacterium]